MRIVFTLLSITICGMLFSQSLSLSNVNATISGLSSDFELICDADVVNNSSSTVNVLASRQVLEGPLGTVNYFCWAACYEPPVSVSPSSIAIEAGASEGIFAGHFRPSNIVGTTKIRYCFFNEAMPTDSVCFVATFEVEPVSVQNASKQTFITDIYPNPSDHVAQLSYAFSQVTNAEIEIYNLVGSKVVSVPFEGLNGHVNIPVSNLLNGIYYYTVRTSGKLLSTGKFSVKH